MPDPVVPNTNEYLELSDIAYDLNTDLADLEPGQNLAFFHGMKVIAQSSQEELAQGFAAIAVDDDGSVVIINEGTLLVNPATAGLNNTAFMNATAAADLQIAQGNVDTPALVDASAFAQQVETQEGGSTPIYVTGHSLGGIEAEAEAQAIVNNPDFGDADFAGGATFGATGLPGLTASQAAASPLTLIDYVDRGDMVGNFAKDTETETPNPIAPDAAGYHYGDVQEIGPASHAAFLKSAQADFITVLQNLTLQTTGGSNIAVTDGYALAGVVNDLSALQYHPMGVYFADLSDSSVTPPEDLDGLPTAPLDIITQQTAASYGNPALVGFGSQTISGGQGIDPYFTSSYSPSTTTITIDQTANISTAQGTAASGGVTTLSLDPSTGQANGATYVSEDGTTYNFTVDETTGNILSIEANESNGASFQINYSYNSDGSYTSTSTAYSGSNLTGSVLFTQTLDFSTAGQLIQTDASLAPDATTELSGTNNTLTFDDASSNSIMLDAGTFVPASSYTNSGTQTVTILKPDGNQLGILTFNTGNDTASFEVFDGFNAGDLTVTLPNISGNITLTPDAAGTDPLQVLKDYLGDLGYTLTSAQITALTTDATGFDTSMMGDDSASATASGQTLKAREGVDTLTGYSGGNTTFQADDGLATGSTLTGHGTGNTMISGGNISGASVSGIQTLQVGDGVSPDSITLTADQFNGFSSVFSPTTFAGTISTSGGGTYDVGSVDMGSDYTFDIADDADTTITGVATSGTGQPDANFVASGNGNDTLTAYAGTLSATGNGNDTLTLGNGGGTITASGDGTNTISTGSGVTSIAASGFGTNTIAAGNGAGDSITVSNGTDTATAGTGAGDSLTATTGGNTLIAGNGTGDTFTAEGGDNVMQAGNGGSTFNIYDDDNTATATGGSNTFNLMGPTGGEGGDIDLGDSVINGGTGGTNTIIDDGNNLTISDASLSNIQVIEAVDTLTLTSAQMAGLTGLSSIDTLDAATSGTYNLAAIDSTDTVRMNDLASGGGTTLIDNDSDGDYVYSNENNDTLTTGNGAGDTVLALSNNDTLTAGSGADDTIDAFGENETVTAGAGSGDTIEALGSGDTITVNGAGASVLAIQGDTITLNGSSDTASLAVGDSTVNVRGSGDTVVDAGGNTFIVGSSGGTSSATLEVADGPDIYEFVQNFGTDTIDNDNAGSTPLGQVVFGSGVTLQNLWFEQVGDNLQVDLMGTTESVTLTNWFSSSGAQVESFIASGGAQLTAAEVAGLVSAMATYQSANPSFDPTAVSSLPSNGTLQAAVTSAWASQVTISDTAADVAAQLDYLQTLAAAGELASITITNSGTLLPITVGQLTGDATALGLISGSYSLAVSGVSAANAATVASDAHVTSVSVSDTGADVAADLNALQTLATAGKLGTVTLTDSAPPTLTVTETQLNDDSGALAAIATSTPYTLSVTNVLAADAATVAENSNVVSIGVSDSAANVTANIAALETLASSGELTSIAFTDSGTPSLTFSASGAAANIDAIADFTGSFTLTVSDSAANVAANIDALGTLAAIGAITAVSFTDSGTPTLDITGTQAENDAAIFSVITGPFNVTLDSDTAATFTSNGDTVSLAGSFNDVTLAGASDTVSDSSSSANNTIVLAGSSGSASAIGTGDTLSDTSAATGNSFTLNADSNAATLNGTDDTATLYGSSNTVTVNGDNSWAYVEGYDSTASVTDNGGGFVLTGALDSGSVSGNNDTATLNGVVESATVTGNDDLMYDNGGQVTLSGTDGDVILGGDYSSATLSGSGDTATVTGYSDSVTVDEADCTVTLESSSTSCYVTLNAPGATVTDTGTDNTTVVNSTPADVSAGGSGGTVWDWGGGNSYTLSGDNTFALLFGGDSTATVSGTDAGIQLAGSFESATLSGTGETITLDGYQETGTLTGDDCTSNDYGVLCTVSLSGTGDAGNVYGTGESVTVSGADSSIDLAGDDQTGTLSGSNGTVTVAGASDAVYLTADAADASVTLGGSNALADISGASSDTVTFDDNGTGTLKLGTAESFVGTVAGLAGDDSIDLGDFLFSGSPTISGVTGTGATGTATTITITDGTVSTQLALLNQFTNQFAVSSSAYTLAADATGSSAGTLFQLAAGH